MVSITRRRILGGIGASLLVASGAVAVVRTRGYELPKGVAERLRTLSPWQYVVLGAVARRIAAPDADDAPSADDVGVADFLDGYLANMPDALRRDFLRLLAFVEHVAPLGQKLASRFTRLPAADQDRVLAWMESNSEGMLRGGFDALKSCVFMGYYRDARTWKIIGYAGPFVTKRPT
ncbi:MAG TPA: gluconate 2-dehydrogenase subunit 3 family protein [Polyangiaceae bacterium]|nr:gluconate 2-dehydrogenase subunit 3 family protein [Polyangiaceae bacterium]